MVLNETDRKTRDERLSQLVKYCMISGALDLNLYAEYDVKRGLRESDGKGVLTGLTEISDVTGFKTIQGEKVPCEGELYYQGYNVMDLKKGFKQRRFNFEEVTYLLLFGALPDKQQLREFIDLLNQYRGASEQICAGCHHEGTESEYHECVAAKRTDPVFL